MTAPRYDVAVLKSAAITVNSDIQADGWAAPQAVEGPPPSGRYSGIPKPVVQNPKLQTILDDLYKPGGTVGDGSTAAARWEFDHPGSLVKGKDHVGKAKQSIKALNNWVSRNWNTASPADKQAAWSVIDDLKNAIGGR